MSEEDLFAEAMRKVRPLEKQAKVRKASGKPQPRPVPIQAADPLMPAGLPAEHLLPRPLEPWVLVADGVSRERLKRLAAGQPPVAETLDLHGMTRDEAIALLGSSISRHLAAGARALCVIHGRGRHSESKPVLKEAVYQWLGDGPFSAQVLAVVPEPGSHGGACLILLRRSGTER